MTLTADFMKTAAVDIRPLLERNWGGISWYTYYIVNGLVGRAARRDLRVVLFYNQRKLLPRYIARCLKAWRQTPNVCIVGYRVPNKLLNLSMRFLKAPYIDELLARHLELRITNYELRINGFDYFFLPNPSFIALSGNTPYIAVCHDLSHEVFPEFFTLRQRLWYRLINPRRFYENAACVIAVSENTKQDIVDLYGIDPSRIDVVYPGIDHELFYPRDDTRTVREKYHLPDSFILSVGTLEPRKNYETVLEAFDVIDRDDITLVIAGTEGWKYDRIYRFLNRMKHKSRVRFLFNVSREDLPVLYSAARLFIYPSFYEGFGFPPLEAAACGAPVIVGHGSSLPEIMGDAALYVDPFNVADVAYAMKRLLLDRELCNSLSAKGKAKAADFTWEKTMRAIVSLLKNYPYPS